MKVELPKYFPPQKSEKTRKMAVSGSTQDLYQEDLGLTSTRQVA